MAGHSRCGAKYQRAPLWKFDRPLSPSVAQIPLFPKSGARTWSSNLATVVPPKLEHFSRQHWRGEKPKPSYLRAPFRIRSLLCSRPFILLTAFALSVTAIFLVTVHVHKRPHNGEDIVDIPKATRKYNEYLASPEHRALVYPGQDDRARGNAALIALVRNSELREMSQSMTELEETFNQKFRYPWIFFNDEPFDDKFKRMTSSLTDAETFYGIHSFSRIGG